MACFERLLRRGEAARGGDGSAGRPRVPGRRDRAVRASTRDRAPAAGGAPRRGLASREARCLLERLRLGDLTAADEVALSTRTGTRLFTSDMSGRSDDNSAARRFHGGMDEATLELPDDFLFEPTAWDLASVIGLEPDADTDRLSLREVPDAELPLGDRAQNHHPPQRAGEG